MTMSKKEFTTRQRLLKSGDIVTLQGYSHDTGNPCWDHFTEAVVFLSLRDPRYAIFNFQVTGFPSECYYPRNSDLSSDIRSCEIFSFEGFSIAGHRKWYLVHRKNITFPLTLFQMRERR